MGKKLKKTVKQSTLEPYRWVWSAVRMISEKGRFGSGVENNGNNGVIRIN